jgi:hypothetical protein
MEKLNRRDFFKSVVGALASSAFPLPENKEVEVNEFPLKEAIADTIDNILNGNEATTTQMFEDEHGIIACIIEFVLVDGEMATIEYMRKGRHEIMNGSNSLRTNMYVTFFDGWRPVGGTNIAEYKSGQWRINEEVLEEIK